MGSEELVEGVRHYRKRLTNSCIYCGEEHDHGKDAAEMCSHCNGTC